MVASEPNLQMNPLEKLCTQTCGAPIVRPSWLITSKWPIAGQHVEIFWSILCPKKCLDPCTRPYTSARAVGVIVVVVGKGDRNGGAKAHFIVRLICGGGETEGLARYFRHLGMCKTQGARRGQKSVESYTWTKLMHQSKSYGLHVSVERIERVIEEFIFVIQMWQSDI